MDSAPTEKGELMASNISKGESLLVPFRNGRSITDSQGKPRMYKTYQAFEKAFPKHYLGTDGVELVEYAPVVRCKDCKHRTLDFFGGHCCKLHKGLAMVTDESFCSYGERRSNA